MKRLIINADDCGISKYVNSEIERYVEMGIISSTTIMANMDDLMGAIEICNKFCPHISTGIHFNLTEGSPLRKSQLLLDEGFLKEDTSRVIFCGKDFPYQQLNSAMKAEIELELEQQICKLLDMGVNLSHFDSHHHVHFHRQILPSFIRVAKKYKLSNMRICNNTLHGRQKLHAELWRFYAKILYPQMHTTDYFCSVYRFFELIDTSKLQKNGIYELMCHPGHKKFAKENDLMERCLPTMLKDNYRLFNYYQL